MSNSHKKMKNAEYFTSACCSPEDYNCLNRLPVPQQRYGAGFGTRTIRDVMVWKQTMGNAPYPWGPTGQKFTYFRK